MKLDTGIARALVVALLAIGCSTREEQSGEPDGGSGATFTTSLAEDRLLTSLDASELETLCADQTAFLSETEFRADVCRLSALLAAGFSSIGAEVTTAELRATCSGAYAECLQAAPTVTCDGESPAPSSCAATIGDLAACLDDTSANTHRLVGEAPDCDSLSAADLVAPDDAVILATEAEPESCQRLQTICPSISDEAKTFSDEYCALIEPCCSDAGLGSDCRANVYQAAEDGSYDASAGEACLDALREREAGADFCDGLASPAVQWESPWQVIPECIPVFGSELVVPVPRGLPTTAELGAACVGTFLSSPDGGVLESYVGTAMPTVGNLCEHGAGLHCDPVMRVCIAGRGLGEACESPEQCDPRSGYCDLPTSLCAPPIPVGEPCTGHFIECEEGALCHGDSQTCMVLADVGEACSTTGESLPPCASGICDGGTCASVLAPLCGR